ncbi:MAG TPA: peptidylprolyl isomerase [Herpetosiphonaceae bacterium]
MAIRRRSRSQRILLEGAAVVAIVLLGMGLRVLWEDIYLPSRPVAQVGDQTASGSYFRKLLELQVVYSAILEQLDTAGAEAHQADERQADHQHRDQAPTDLVSQVAAELRALQNAPMDHALIDHWILEETLLQGAEREQRGVDDTAVLAALAQALQADAQEGDHHHDDHQEQAPDAHGKQADRDSISPDQARQIIDSTLSARLTRLAAQLEQNSPGLSINFSPDELREYALRLQRLDLLRDRIAEALVPATSAPIVPQVQAQSLFLSIPISLTKDVKLRETALEPRKAEADQIYARLMAGADFSVIAREHALDDHGITPYWTIAQRLLPGAREALQTLPIGQISQPVKTEVGWGIYKVLSREQRPDEQQLRQMREDALQSWLTTQQATLGITRFVEPPAEAPGPHEDLGPDHRQPQQQDAPDDHHSAAGRSSHP